MTYTITNIVSGKILGEYDGATPLEAYRAMMTDAGYETEEHARSAGYTLAEMPAEIRVTATE